MLMSHSNQINDMIIKDYIPSQSSLDEEESLSIYTGGKDNTLRLWEISLNRSGWNPLSEESSPFR